MASPVKLLPLFFLSVVIFASLEIHARESQFFGKVSGTSIGSNNNAVNQESSNVGHEQVSRNEPPSHKQEPSSADQESHRGHGLYGHESDQLPPNTATSSDTNSNNNEADKFTFSELTDDEMDSTEEYNSGEGQEHYHELNNNNNNNNNVYYGSGAKHYSLSDARFGEHNSQSSNNYNGNLYQRQRGQSHGTSSNNYNGNQYHSQNQPQGMSDTRFLENGKYYYDVSNERLNNPNSYQLSARESNEGYGSHRRFNSRNQYHNNNYEGARYSYGNDENSDEPSNYYNSNSMGRNSNYYYDNMNHDSYQGQYIP